MSTDNEMLRSLVREALRDALGGADGIRDAAKALSGQTQQPTKLRKQPTSKLLTIE